VIKRTPLTKSAREERRQLRIERRKQLAREQKALLKAVKARQKEQQQQQLIVVWYTTSQNFTSNTVCVGVLVFLKEIIKPILDKFVIAVYDR